MWSKVLSPTRSVGEKGKGREGGRKRRERREERVGDTRGGMLVLSTAAHVAYYRY